MDDTVERASTPAVSIVVMLASAGGLSAISTVIQGLPDDLATAVVVQHHLSGQGSVLVPLLRRRTGARIDWATSGQTIEPGKIVICPPMKRLELYPDGTCVLHDADGARSLPHDALLRSVADSYGPRALAIVLTGYGRDGAEGIKAIKAAGGAAIAQNEDTAEQSSMPRAAAQMGADLVLPLHEIAGAIVDFVSGGRLPLPPAEVEAAAALFAGDGEVCARLREIDWFRSALGPVESWPASLRTMLRVVLASPMPMVIIWGPERIQLYNDNYRDLIADRHPAELGQSNREYWPEVWHLNEPIFDRVFGGEAVALEDALYPIVRNGTMQDSWYTV
ncbi:MAG TPA: chemotaxis protein CheB, partial [Mycobacterium sp.]|nr:chemotaxis protein CheB [Mycobacterium sp.]